MIGNIKIEWQALSDKIETGPFGAPIVLCKLRIKTLPKKYYPILTM